MKVSSRWPVFLFFACLYALSLGRGFYSSDGDVMFKTTVALAETHTLALDPDPGLPQIVAGNNARFYSKYDPGLPLLAAPFYVLGDWIAHINAAHRYHVAAIFVLLLPVIAAAGALAGLARIVADLRGAYSNTSLRSAWTIVIAAGLATPLWVYARTLFAETILAAALTWTVVLIHDVDITNLPRKRHYTQDRESLPYLTPQPPLQTRRGGVRAFRNTPLPGERFKGLGRLFFAGIIFGTGILTRAAFAITLPALIWLIVRAHPTQNWRDMASHSRDHAIQLAVFGAGIVPFAAILVWHNGYRFGSAWQSGYAGEGFTTPVWEGVIGLLFSPGKSVFLYAPPLILSVILWPRFRRVSPALGEFLAVAWGCALVFYGAWWAWHGGWCWGPRFLVPLMPVSCLPLIVGPTPHPFSRSPEAKALRQEMTVDKPAKEATGIRARPIPAPLGVV